MLDGLHSDRAPPRFQSRCPIRRGNCELVQGRLDAVHTEPHLALGRLQQDARRGARVKADPLDDDLARHPCLRKSVADKRPIRYGTR